MDASQNLTYQRPALQVVQTADGPVSVVAIDYLDKTAADIRGRAQQLAAQAASATQAATNAEAQAGAILVTRRTAWAASDRGPALDAAAGLVALVSQLESSLAEVRGREHHGLGGLLDRVKDSNEANGLELKLRSAQSELNNRYRDVVSGLGADTGIGEADTALQLAKTNSAQSTELAALSSQAAQDAEKMESESKRRKAVVAKLGFDALGIEADLDLNGIRPVVTGIVLKPKEVAAIQVQATLCRYATKTHYVGGSHGLSIPLGHGFRYRVSSFQGHPVQSQSLAQVDQGQLIVTNQRLVFAGQRKDVATPLAKLVAVEAYADGIGIGREGKESRDVYLVARPAEVLLYLNWVVSHQT